MGNSTEQSLAVRMQEQLAEKIMPLLDLAPQGRARHFEAHPESLPGPNAVSALISDYSTRCGAIALTCNLVPGPFGLLAIVPEIGLIIKTQLEMIYDIGRALGHKDIPRELLLGILLSSTGTGTAGLIVVHGGKVVIKRASLRLIQKLVAALGGKVTQRVLKSALAKWVPLVGAGAMALWARHSTKKLGQKAQEIFSQEIVLEAEILDDQDGEVTPDPDLLVERLRLLVTVARLDRKVDSREAEFLETAFADPDLSEASREELKSALATGKVPAVNFAAFEGRKDEQLAVVMDMIALMAVDGSMHPTERLFILDTAGKFGLEQADIEEMIALEMPSRRD